MLFAILLIEERGGFWHFRQLDIVVDAADAIRLLSADNQSLVTRRHWIGRAGHRVFSCIDRDEKGARAWRPVRRRPVQQSGMHKADRTG